LTSHQAPFINKVIFTLGILTSIVQNVNFKVQGIESKMHIVDSHSQSIDKFKTQLGQLATTMGNRQEEKLLSYPIQNPKV